MKDPRRFGALGQFAKLFGRHVAQGPDELWQGTSPTLPKSADDRTDDDPGLVVPDIVARAGACGLGDDETGKPICVRRRAHVIERVPAGTTRIEGIEDQIAAFGPVVARHIASIDIVDKRMLPSPLHLVEQGEDRGGLTGSGGPREQEVPGLFAFRNGNAPDPHRRSARPQPYALGQQSGIDHLGAPHRPVPADSLAFGEPGSSAPQIQRPANNGSAQGGPDTHAPQQAIPRPGFGATGIQDSVPNPYAIPGVWCLQVATERIEQFSSLRLQVKQSAPLGEIGRGLPSYPSPRGRADQEKDSCHLQPGIGSSQAPVSTGLATRKDFCLVRHPYSPRAIASCRSKIA